MSTDKRPRRPRETRGAGPFAATKRPEPQLAWGERVDAAPNTERRIVESWTSAGTGDAEFNRRVLILLGVTDPAASVSVTMASATELLYGFSDTVNTWTDITIVSGENRRSFDDLPALLRHLEHAESPTVDLERVRPMPGHRVRLHTRVGPVLTGVVSNASAYQMYFTADEVVRHLDLEWDGAVLRPWFQGILHIEFAEPAPCT